MVNQVFVLVVEVTGKLIFDDKNFFFWLSVSGAVKCLPLTSNPIFAALSETCEHTNIQAYRHLDIYGRIANDGGAGP